jgi:hypothetical protein
MLRAVRLQFKTNGSFYYNIFSGICQAKFAKKFFLFFSQKRLTYKNKYAIISIEIKKGAQIESRVKKHEKS